ncbi:MAG: phosphate-starvation-inducible PsiE family protein [Nitrospirota bacterium]|nr:phosphate-starvation-inducible PsiE family protein [Nitrospirota bacterium]
MKTMNSRLSLNVFQPSLRESSSWITQALAADLTHMWMKGIKAVLSLLIITILLGLTGGVVRIFLNLQSIFSHPLEQALRHLSVDTLIILAIVEVFKTTLTYFSEGRVKVTFIVDTILVVMLTEIISKWFSEAPVSQWITLGGILLILGIIRIVAVQWSPTKAEQHLDPQSAS